MYTKENYNIELPMKNPYKVQMIPEHRRNQKHRRNKKTKDNK